MLQRLRREGLHQRAPARHVGGLVLVDQRAVHRIAMGRQHRIGLGPGRRDLLQRDRGAEGQVVAEDRLDVVVAGHHPVARARTVEHRLLLARPAYILGRVLLVGVGEGIEGARLRADRFGAPAGQAPAAGGAAWKGQPRSVAWRWRRTWLAPAEGTRAAHAARSMRSMRSMRWLQSSVILRSRISLCQRAVSARSMSAYSAGLFPTGSTPKSTSFWCTPGSLMAATTAVEHRHHLGRRGRRHHHADQRRRLHLAIACLGKGRHLGQLRQPHGVGHRQRPHLAGLDEGRAGRVIDHHGRDLARGHVGQRRRSAAVRRVGHVQAGLHLQQFHGEVMRAAGPGRAVVHAGGTRLGPAMKSCTVLAGEAGPTTGIIGKRPISVTGAKSLPGCS